MSDDGAPAVPRLGASDLERIAAAAAAGQPADAGEVLALVREVQRARAAAESVAGVAEQQRAQLKQERETVRMLKKMLMDRGG